MNNNRQQGFKGLDVYHQAYSLSKDLYNELKDVQGHFRIKDQLLAAVTSICANLAENSAYHNSKQQVQKVLVCIGEASEAEFWCDFCTDVGLLPQEKHRDYINRIKAIRMSLYNLRKAYESTNL